ncbi:MAG TPA: YdeI/OmpD-associated family protein [Gillisia sp.]|nr:YdeI/OmpD-associated family protein [Gillisia sp.]
MAKAVTVEQYIEQHRKWARELSKLRDLLLSYDLEEGIKWGGPVYMRAGTNLFGLGAFKNHYAIWFFQGGLLEKNTKLLINAREGKTHTMRQIRFDETSDLNLKELSSYINETISLHKQGKKISVPPNKEVILPEGLKTKFKKDPELENAFQKLTPGKQREYSDYISQAKREETRISRLEKITPLVFAGKGLNDKYKN